MKIKHYSHGVVKESVHGDNWGGLGICFRPRNLYEEGFGVTIFTYLKKREVLGL